MLDTSPTTTHYIAFFLVFLAVSVGIFFLAKLLEGLIGIAALGIFNKLLGALFGFGKYLLITSVALYFFTRPMQSSTGSKRTPRRSRSCITGC